MGQKFPAFFQPFPENTLTAFFRGEVVAFMFQTFRQAGHVGLFFCGVVGVDIALPIVQFFHKLRGGIADHQGNRLRELCQGICFCGFICAVNRIGTGGQGQIDHGLGQIQTALRHSVEMAGLICRHGQGQPDCPQAPHPRWQNVSASWR